MTVDRELALGLEEHGMTITSEMVTEAEHFCFITEASTVGLPPGNFPAAINTDLGNGHSLVLDRICMHGHAHYRQVMGCIKVTVLND